MLSGKKIINKVLAFALSASIAVGGVIYTVPTIMASTETRTADTIQNDRCYINGDEISAYDIDDTVYIMVDYLTAYGFTVTSNSSSVSIEWGGEYYFDEDISPTTDDDSMNTTGIVSTSSVTGSVDGETVDLYTINGDITIKATDLAEMGYYEYDESKNVMNVYITEAGYTQNDDDYRNIVVNASESTGTITSMLGAHYDPGEEGSESSIAYVDAGIGVVRTHDIDEVEGDSRGIIYNICPDYFDTIKAIAELDTEDENYETDLATLQAHLATIDLTDESSYDFEDLDAVIDDILDIGSEVYFRFGASQNDVEDNTFPEEGTEEWYTFLDNLTIIAEQIVQHYQYGWDDGYTDALSYFEVWNEPELDTFWPNTTEQYYEMYASISQAVKELDEDLPVGGPVLTTLNDYEGYEESFIAYVAENDLPLDFYAFHYYPTINSDPYDYSRWAYELDDILEEYGLGDVPMVLSEFGSTLCSLFGLEEPFDDLGATAESTYITSALIYLQDTDVTEAITYFSLVSTDEETGEITYESPYYAYLAMNQMNDTSVRLSTSGGDENGFAVIAGTNEEENQINVLLSNYEMPTSQMLSNEEAAPGLVLGGLLSGNDLIVPDVATWTLPAARVLTYENNSGYNLTVEDVTFDTETAIVEQYRIDEDNDYELIGTVEVPISDDGTITFSSALSTYSVDLLQITPGAESDDTDNTEITDNTDATDNTKKTTKDNKDSTTTVTSTTDTAATVTGEIPSDSVFTFEQIDTESTKYTEIAEILAGEDYEDLGTFVIYDLDLTDPDTGITVEITDDGVEVSMPVPDELADVENIAVFVQEEDGTLTKLDCTVENGMITFTAPHFSTYVFAEVLSNEASTSGVSTGDSSNTILWLSLTAGVLSIGGVYYYKRKKEVTL